MRRPSHHDMHAQNANPGALFPVPHPSGHRPRGSHRSTVFYAQRTPHHALRISYMQAHVISLRFSVHAAAARDTRYLRLATIL
jgi:hypothetical protein